MSINKETIENMIREHELKKQNASDMASMWWKIETHHKNIVEQLKSLIEGEQNAE